MPKLAALPPTLPPRLIGREAAAAYINVSPNTLDKMVGEGRMPRPRVLGDKRRAWDTRELDMAVDQLPHDGEELAAADQGWT
jgi:excisionase family DNA binding protein